MKSKSGLRLFWLLIGALLLCLIFPIIAAGQGRWNRGHFPRGRAIGFYSHPVPRGRAIGFYRHSVPRGRAIGFYGHPARQYGVYRVRSYSYQPRVIYAPRPYYGTYNEPYVYRYRPIRHRNYGRFHIYFRR